MVTGTESLSAQGQEDAVPPGCGTAVLVLALEPSLCRHANPAAIPSTWAAEPAVSPRGT